MKKVGSRELKNRLGRYLAQVERGETIVVTDRGRPVARLAPVSPEGPDQKTLEEVLKELAAAGHIRLALQPRRPARRKLIRAKGKPLSRTILEDRE